MINKFKILLIGSIFIVCFMIVNNSDVYARVKDISIPLLSINMYPPFELESSGIYKDGGTIGIIIKDSKGTLLPLCYDGRIKTPLGKRYLYVGATNPNSSKAKRVIKGSATEESILKILKNVTILKPSKYKRADLIKHERKNFICNPYSASDK